MQYARNPIVLWLMGPTSSGKTTIAEKFMLEARQNNFPIIHFDGDEIRGLFGEKHGFSPSERLSVVKAIVHLAQKSNLAGLNVIVSALTANPCARSYLKDELPNSHVVYVECSIETCSSRDPKGLYRKAKMGNISTLVGVNSDYLPPDDAGLVIDTESNSVEESTLLLLQYFEKQLLSK